VNNEQILELAFKCGFQAPYFFEKQLAAFAKELMQIQREEDAGICDRFGIREMHPAECASAIRKGGEE
jgi:hypothetical protein